MKSEVIATPVSKSVFPTIPVRTSRPLLRILSALAVMAEPSLHAASTITWNSSADGNDWSNSASWTGLNTPPLAADTALFKTSVGTTGAIGLAGNATIANLSFDTNAGSANSTLTIGSVTGGTLTLGNGGTIQILSTLAGTGKTLSINAPLLFAGNGTSAGSATISNNNASATNVLNFGGSIANGNSNPSGGYVALTLSGSNAGLNTISGVISNGAAGGMVLIKAGVGKWCLTGSNNYTGGTTINAGSLVISGTAGGVASSSSVTVNTTGTLTLDSSTGINTSNRARAVTFGATAMSAGASVLTAIGNGSANSTEKISGALTFSAGLGVVSLTPGTGYNETIAAGSLVRNATMAPGVALFRGTSLGKYALNSNAANSTNVTFTTAPTLVGGGGAAGTPTVGIIPWVVIDNTSATGMGSSLATYDTTYGLRALNDNEYVTTVASGDTSNSNLKLNAGSNLTLSGGSAPTVVNSVTLNGGNAVGSGTLAVSSGAIFAAASGTLGTAVTLGMEGNFNAASGATLNVNNLLLTGSSAGLNLGSTGAGTVNVTIASSGTLGHLSTTTNNNANVNLTLKDGVSVTVGSDGVGSSYNGTISGSGGLVKTGAGILYLSSGAGSSGAYYAGNRYSGNIDINQGSVFVNSGIGNTPSTYTAWITTGTLSIASAGSLSLQVGQFGAGGLSGSGSISIFNRAFGLNYNGSAVDVFKGSITTNRSVGYFLKFGTGTVSLQGDISGITGQILNSWGTLQTPAVSGTGTLSVYGGTAKITGTTGVVTGLGYSNGGASFGNTLSGGTLWIAPDTVSAQTDVTVSGLTSAGVAGASAMDFRTEGGRILLDKGGNRSVTYTIGGATAGTLGTISGAGGLIIAAAHGLTELGVTEKFSTLTSMKPTLVNGIVSPRILGQDASAGSSLKGDFLTYVGTGVAGDVGFKAFDYSSATGDTNFLAPTIGKVEKVTQDTALTGSTAVFALRNDGKTIDLGTSNTLTVGDSSTVASAGLIMNGGVIKGGTLELSSFALGAANIYTSADNATISSALKLSGGANRVFVEGPGVLTYSGALFSNSVIVNYGSTFESTSSSFSGALTLAGGVYQSNGSFTRALGSSGVTFVGSVSSAGGGFAARGGALNVNLGGSSTPATLVWNNGETRNGNQTSASFLQDNQSFIFGSSTADSEVNMMNPLDLGGNTANFSRVIYVYDNPNSSTDQVRFTGGISSISDNNGIAKDGAGRLILDGNNTYKGATYVAAGSLIVSGSLSATSLVEVHKGATLGGTGVINSAAALRVEEGGKVSPGSVDALGQHTTGALTVGSVSLDAGAVVALTLTGATAGSYDQLVAAGSVNLGSGAELDLTLTLIPGGGKMLFDLIETTGIDNITGTFSSIFVNGIQLSLGSDNTFNFTYGSNEYAGRLSYYGTETALTGGNDFVLEIAAVPEARTSYMVLVGAAALAFYARRRRASEATVE